MAKIREQCNFCGKRKDQVRKLVAGPGVFICDRCIELCNEVLRDDRPSVPGSAVGRSRWRRVTNSGWFRNLSHFRSYTT